MSEVHLHSSICPMSLTKLPLPLLATSAVARYTQYVQYPKLPHETSFCIQTYQQGNIEDLWNNRYGSSTDLFRSVSLLISGYYCNAIASCGMRIYRPCEVQSTQVFLTVLLRICGYTFRLVSVLCAKATRSEQIHIILLFHSACISNLSSTFGTM